MSGLGVSNLAFLPAWSPSQFPRAAVGSEHENYAGNRPEDGVRRKGLQKALPGLERLRDRVRAKRLFRDLGYFDDPGAPVPKTLASKAYTATVSDNVAGAIWHLCQGIDPKLVSTFTCVPRGWRVQAGRLSKVSARRLMARFRTELYRVGLAHLGGWIIAFIHGEYDPETGEYIIHIHGVAVGRKRDAIDRLRKRAGYQFEEGDTVRHRVRMSRKPLTDLPRPFTYLLKGYWPSRRIGPVGQDGKIGRVRAARRIPEPCHTEVLLWLDRHSPEDLCLLLGCRVGRDGCLRARPVGSVHQ